MSNVIKKSLQTTVFTSVLTAAAIFPASAYTVNSDMIELAPVTPWSVSRAAGNSAQAYCTLSKTFKKDIILTLAENSEQNLTFALDFQKDRFVPQSTYNIILATDNGDSRSYELKPATGKAFVIYVKNDPEFYENLWKSSSLVVSVNTENYRFNTAEFANGRTDISSCLAMLKQTKPKEKEDPKISGLTSEISNIPVSTVTQIKTKNAMQVLPDVPEKQGSMTEPAVLKVGLSPENFSELSNLKEQVQSLKQANLSLKSALEEERKAYNANLSASNQKSSTESETLLQKVSILSNENKQLQKQIHDYTQRTSTSSINITQKLTSEISRLKSENKLLQASLETNAESQSTVNPEDYEDLKRQNTDLNEHVQKLTSENQRLKTLVKQSKGSNTETSALLERLTRENADLKENISLKDTKISELSKSLTLAQTKVHDYDTLKKQISALKTENKSLADSYAALESAAGEATPSNADSELLALQQRYAEQERELQRMSKQMQKERQRFEIEQKRLESMLFDPAVTERKQLEHLARLEQELKLANQALAEQRAMYEGGKVPANTISLPPVSEMTASERTALMDMSKEIQRLRDEINRLRRLQQMPVISKAEGSEKQVVLTRGTTLETAPTVDEIKEKIKEQDALLSEKTAALEEENTESVAVDLATSEKEDDLPEQEMPNTSSAQEQEQVSTEIVAIEEMPEENSDDAQKIVLPPSEKELASAETYKNKPPAIVSLPDPFMVEKIKQHDEDFKITKQENEEIFWISEEIEGRIIRKHLQGQDFETSVEGLIDNLKNQCPMPLEINPLVLRKGNPDNLYAYDASCGNIKLGIVFFTQDGVTLSTVSYGAPMEQKDLLESKQEKLIESLMESMHG